MTKCCLERRLIGEILIERGLITQENLHAALERQKAAPGSFVGEVLIRMGFISEIDIVTALVVQCNLPYIAISKHSVDDEIIRLIPAEMARRNRLVPLDRIGNVLSVVMASPVDESLRHDVEKVTGCMIATFISTPSEIDLALARFYS